MERNSFKKVSFSDQQRLKPDPQDPELFFQPKRDRVNTEELISENYELLTNRIEGLGDKVEHILSVHEKDFMSAFRAHMFQVQKQLLEMKKRVDEQETKLRRDEQIQQLESALGRIQDAALKLEGVGNHYKKEAEEWKGKAQELEQERDFLQKQLVTLMRQNSQKKEEEWSLPVLKPFSSSSKDLPPVQFRPTSDFGIWLQNLALKHSVQSVDFLKDTEVRVSSVHQQFEDSVQHLKRTVTECKRQIRRLQASNSAGFADKSDLESLFLDCVEEVRKEISVRKGLDANRRSPIKMESRDKDQLTALGEKWGIAFSWSQSLADTSEQDMFKGKLAKVSHRIGQETLRVLGNRCKRGSVASFARR